MAAAHAPEWTATLLSGDGRASSPHENERPLLVVPVCHDGSTRSQVCHQALRQLQSEGRVRIDLAAPHAMLHGVDPFVAPVMSYAQFMAIATSGSDADFERETAWKYQPMSSTSVQSVDDSAAADFLFNSAFGSPRVPRLAEPALAAEFPGLDAKLAARDVEHTLAVRARVDALVYQQNLLRAPAAPNAVLASGKAAAVKRAPVATLLLAFNRSVHALVFRLLECALRSRSAGVSLRHVVVQPIMMPDPFAMAVTLNSDAPLKSARECLLRVMQSAAAGGR